MKVKLPETKLPAIKWRRESGYTPAYDDSECVLALLKLVEELRPSHYFCPDDNWYSCPKAPEGCANAAKGDACNCGADERNVEIDDRLVELGLKT